MKHQKLITTALSLFTAAALFVSESAHAGDTTTLKVGTLAPAESPWGKVFKVWQKGIKQRTNGAVEIQFFWNGQQGDEGAMVNKIRSGQLDGAAITATGLSNIYKQVLVMQMPGVFGSWAKLDAARGKLKGKFDEAFEKEGFKNLGWGDVGAARIMSKGFAVKTPNDIKKKGVYTLKGDPIGPVMYSVIGDVTPKEITIPEITPALTAGTINMINSPALAAEPLQWAPLLDNINSMVTGYAIGALVFSSSRFKGLPADVQTALVETGNVTAVALTNSIRQADDAAFARLKQRMTVYEPTDADKAEWRKVTDAARAKLKGGTFKAEDIAAVEEAGK